MDNSSRHVLQQKRFLWSAYGNTQGRGCLPSLTELFTEKSYHHRLNMRQAVMEFAKLWSAGWLGGVIHRYKMCKPTCFHTCAQMHDSSHNKPNYLLTTRSAKNTGTPKADTFVPLTSSCQFSLNHTIWSTMPSREDRRVGCSSRCMCMIRLQRHIGAVARIGPGSEAPEWGWAPTELGCCCPDASAETSG